jgi:hypothetical protein
MIHYAHSPGVAFTVGEGTAWKASLPAVLGKTRRKGDMGNQFFMSRDSKPAFSAPPEQMIRSRARTGTTDALFPKSGLPVFSLLFAFGEII